jgi:hypothetical protein
LLPETIAAVFKTHLASEVFAKEACRALVACIASEEDDVIGRVAIAGAGALVLKVTNALSTTALPNPYLAPYLIPCLYLIPCPFLTPRSKVPSPISLPGPRSTCPHLTHCPVSHPHFVLVLLLLLLLATFLQAIKKHPESEGLCTHAFHLLYLLSSDPAHVGRLVSHDLLDALSTTLEGRSCAAP